MYRPRNLSILAGLVLSIFAITSTANAEFVGLDSDGDLDCDPSEMAVLATGEDIGTTHTLDLFFDDLPPIVSWGCVFCTPEKSRVTNVSWIYSLPDGWTDNDIEAIDSESVYPSITPSASITDIYPNYRCWYVQATDFSFENPMTTFPFAVGSFSFDVAEEGCIGFILDGPNCGWFSTMFVTGNFDGPNETCGPFDCEEPTSTESMSWGSVKTLFR